LAHSGAHEEYQVSHGALDKMHHLRGGHLVFVLTVAEIKGERDV
jgi:hypothetical protein